VTSPIGVTVVTGPRPCSATEAVQRALSIVGQGGEYELGGGDYYPVGGLDLPWTRNAAGRLVCDCSRFAIVWCYKLRGHRPGFNRGDWATVSDDINPNSAIEDADHARELFERIYTPFPGALICYPTIHLEGHAEPWIGHVKIVTGITRCVMWNPELPDWSLLDTAECMGPPGRRPGVIAGTGAEMVAHDRNWPKPEHRTVMLRVLA
jgi:hypothetical protein